MSSASFVNVFWCNISSQNCYHKHDIHNLIYMIFHMKMMFMAMLFQDSRKYFKKKQEPLMHLQHKHFMKLNVSCLW